MKFLIDNSPAKLQGEPYKSSQLVGGQFITPLTGNTNAGTTFAIDNGAFTRFKAKKFASLLKRDLEHIDRCLFVVCPDVVADARRTLELWEHRYTFIPDNPMERPNWKRALVAQDGLENMTIPWDELDTIFIGGGDPWKDGQSSQNIVKTAKTLGKHVHVGRVNNFKRYQLFASLGADTCDGSGIARYRDMLPNIEKQLAGDDGQVRLFEKVSNE